jgi:hypothetical protein
VRTTALPKFTIRRLYSRRFKHGYEKEYFENYIGIGRNV